MADNSWVFDIGGVVLATLEYEVKRKLTSSAYKNLNFTTSSNNSITLFPTVYYHELTGNEKAETLIGNVINSIDYSVQIEIYSDKSQDICKRVAKEVVNTMKDLGFEITMPTFQNESTTYRLVMRFSRTICSGDKLFM